MPRPLDRETQDIILDRMDPRVAGEFLELLDQLHLLSGPPNPDEPISFLPVLDQAPSLAVAA
jgi:hypothetical protein